MNPKGLYIGIILILLILVFGVNESFIWQNPDYLENRMGPNCQVRELPNCAVIDRARPQYCLKCILDDGTGETTQPFIKKNFTSPTEKGKGGCELNTANPGNDTGPDPNWCLSKKDAAQGWPGCANLKINPTNIGSSRLTNYSGGGCLPGTIYDDMQIARFRYEFWGDCTAENHYKTRCRLPASTLKQWVQEKRVVNGIDLSQIDELPDSGDLY